MPTCDLCGSEYQNPSLAKFGLLYATEHYKKVFSIHLYISADLKDGNGIRPADLCDNCRQKLFDELVKNNEKSNR